MISRSALLIALVLAFSGLAGCGKKGLLDVPEGATYPQPYPRP